MLKVQERKVELGSIATVGYTQRVENQENYSVAPPIKTSINPDFSTIKVSDDDSIDTPRRLVFAFLAFLFWVMSVAFIAFIPAIFLYPYIASQGIELSDTGRIVEFAKNDASAIFLQIIAIIPAHLLTFLLAWIILAQGRKYKFLKTLGWEKGGTKWWHYFAILIAFVLISIVVGSLVPEQENDLVRMLRSSRSALYIIAFVATFSAPFIEEVIYRGVLYSAFQRAFGLPAAFVLVTALFALVHVPQYYPSYSTIFLLTLLSVTLTGLRVYSNNLLPCVILHTFFNGFQSILLLLEPLTRDTKDPLSFLFHILPK